MRRSHADYGNLQAAGRVRCMRYADAPRDRQGSKATTGEAAGRRHWPFFAGYARSRQRMICVSTIACDAALKLLESFLTSRCEPDGRPIVRQTHFKHVSCVAVVFDYEDRQAGQRLVRAHKCGNGNGARRREHRQTKSTKAELAGCSKANPRRAITITDHERARARTSAPDELYNERAELLDVHRLSKAGIEFGRAF
jgi:hypothetical protein